MKKFIIILGVILTSGVAALAITLNKNTEIKTAQVKNDRSELVKSTGGEFGYAKNNIANAD